MALDPTPVALPNQSSLVMQALADPISIGVILCGTHHQIHLLFTMMHGIWHTRNPLAAPMSAGASRAALLAYSRQLSSCTTVAVEA